MSTTELARFKSSHSGTQDDNCVEVSLEWRKSTYSDTAGDNCIEIAPTPTTIHVRDSKDATRPHLGLAPSAWAPFVAFAAAQAD
ncbi:DUF397 domain-containing protein [Streptomyces stelliscabiei]|uniref:DUF397 domain-containing protein n=1 Tax=Streptomyces stelliscabiei TaxID=146820 RepID=UPI0029A4DB63|nr:DUF397 domain-containing protein [Streptomyces stelliscabiei]MDX2553963.1 DUF397 domain-containing protein [Streptomyces stelliscabiei]MDX2612706.1 DUF397 domain-containing protein [Streptomyces stelliscabiei]MDX2638250.1 DUF397 domain-containing protein [Streptomyces stelliscabiei]MDX2665996.1 DUF397 domain-containing protein [Streptomyces stelliscabiei]MDX2716605.1 DUF397 domain-containing protein [Streptomyces stelliscabiei]